MPIEADFQSLIAPLVSGRCYPLVAPDSPVKPYATYQVVSNTPLLVLDGQTGTEQLRIQLDLWAETYAAVKVLEKAVKEAAQSAPFSMLPLMTVDGYEADTKLFRLTMDFSVWSQ